MTVSLIVAIANNGVIGNSTGMPWYIPDDLKHVKAITMGHVLVMGRKTYDTIGRPLPGRTSIVVTRNPEWSAEGIMSEPSVKEALDLAATIDDEAFIFGGAEIYRLAIDHTDRLLVTEIHANHEGDTYFPEIDWSRWRETERIKNDGYHWVTYERATPSP